MGAPRIVFLSGLPTIGESRWWVVRTIWVSRPELPRDSGSAHAVRCCLRGATPFERARREAAMNLRDARRRGTGPPVAAPRAPEATLLLLPLNTVEYQVHQRIGAVRDTHGAVGSALCECRHIEDHRRT